MGTASRAPTARELSVQELRRTCPADLFDFESTEQVEPLEGTIGQERAVNAITFGFEIKARGYNIFASGSPGTGRNFAVQAYVGEYAQQEPAPPDWIYVHNFDEPREPRAMTLPAGRGRELGRDMDGLIAACRSGGGLPGEAQSPGGAPLGPDQPGPGGRPLA